MLALTRRRFSKATRGTLASEGIDHTKYCIHNFHIRVTTTAAAKGIGDAAIKVVEPCSMCTFPENSWVLLLSDRIALDFINDKCCKLGLAEEAGPLLGLDGGYTLLILPLCLIHDTGLGDGQRVLSSISVISLREVPLQSKNGVTDDLQEDISVVRMLTNILLSYGLHSH